MERTATGVVHGLTQAAGALIVLAVLEDVFFTVLFPGSGRGLLRRPLARATWAVVRVIGQRIGNRDRRRRFLGYSGPLQITVNLTAWILALITGWALIFQPALGTQIVSSSGHTDTSWATSFYYSGYTLTTLGFGDVVARTGLYRLLTVLEAVIGFATVSMAITYFLSVYSALTQRKVTAARLHHRTYDTGDAAALLAGMARDGEIPGAPDEFGELAEFFQRVLETHAAYPVLRYFRQPESWSTLPRVLLVALDGVTLVHSVLDPGSNHDLLRSPSVWSLRVAAEQLLDELLPGLKPPVSGSCLQSRRKRRRRTGERGSCARPSGSTSSGCISGRISPPRGTTTSRCAPGGTADCER